MTVIDASRLLQKRRSAPGLPRGADRHAYFQAVAEARYVLRKAFRIVEEQAKAAGIDPLAQQALIQVYGSPTMELRIRDVAERLDISPAFASNLVKSLVDRGYATRSHGGVDKRTTTVAVTKAGIKLLHDIDQAVAFHVGQFSRKLTDEQKDLAVRILMFYVGMTP